MDSTWYPLGTGYQSKGCSFFFMPHLSVEK